MKASLPASKGNCFDSEDGRSAVMRFLEEFYHVYDSDDRRGLLDAYLDSSVMSLTVSPIEQPSQSPAGLEAYLKDRRNLPQSNYELGKLSQKNGKKDIVSFLNTLPKTTHIGSSFVVDVSDASSSSIVASVTGLFRERECAVVRSFQRVFDIVPLNGGFCITNEQFHIDW